MFAAINNGKADRNVIIDAQIQYELKFVISLQNVVLNKMVTNEYFNIDGRYLKRK